MIIKPKSKICIIEYNKDKSVQQALAHAGEYDGFKFNVSRELSRPVSKKKHIEKDKDPDWILDPEVQEELNAMGGVSIIPKTYNLRSEGVYLIA